MTGRRTTALLASGLKQYVRTPVLLILLVILPADLVGVVTSESTEMPVEVSMTGVETVHESLPDVVGAFMGPLAAAVVSGIFGLFVMQRALDADSRLAIAGYRPLDVVLARLGLVAMASLLVTAVVVAVLTLQFVPAFLPMYAAAVLLSAVAYGMVGALLGLTIDRLAGVYVMLMLPMVDILLFQNPIKERAVAGSELLPGHYVTRAAIDAGFGNEFDAIALLAAAGYVCVLVALTTGAFHRTVKAT